MEKVEPKILSLFSGCGGLDLGFEIAGYKTVWANDMGEWVVKTFESHFGKNIIIQENIESIKPLFEDNYEKTDLHKINEELNKLSVKERLTYDRRGRKI